MIHDAQLILAGFASFDYDQYPEDRETERHLTKLIPVEILFSACGLNNQ